MLILKYIMKNKILGLLVLVFLLVGGIAYAQEQTTSTILETTTTIVGATTTSKPAVMPFSFTINKWFLQLRKAITTSPVQKAKLDTQILEKEENAINKMVETNKIAITDKLVTGYIQKKENITNQLEKLKNEGNKVDNLIASIKNNTVDQASPLAKKLEKATDEQKALIISNLEKNKENIQKRIEVKEGVLQNTKTDEELKALKDQITLISEDQKTIFNQLTDLVKDKLLLLNEVQKNHFFNYLRLRISKLTSEGMTKIKQQITDGSIKVELENIIDKIVNVNSDKKAIIDERKDLNKETQVEKQNIIETVKQKIQDLKDTKVKTLTPEEKQKIMNEAKDLKQKSINELKTLNEVKNQKLEELKNKMQDIQKPAKPVQQMNEAIDSIEKNSN